MTTTAVITKGYDYDFGNLLESYSKLGVGKGKLIYVASDLTKLMQYEKTERGAVLKAHLDAFRELLGPEGTLFVPTATTYLCNTDTVFDPATTPSKGMGVFSEYVRTREGAVRSFHPFWSVTGIGPRAHDILADVSRHAYGYGSLWQKFVESDVLGINVGKPPRLSIPVIHHIETVVGVPYRYTKEFIHPVLRDRKISREPFYLSVLYRECDIVRNKNVEIFSHFKKSGTLNEVEIGRGHAWSFSYTEFFRVTTQLFLRNPYCWLGRPPSIRPYQK